MRSLSIIILIKNLYLFSSLAEISYNEPATIKVLEDGQYNASDFIKSAKKDNELLYSQLLENIQQVVNPKIKELLLNIFENAEIKHKFSLPSSL